MGNENIKQAEQYMQENGFRPLAGINADYFSFKTGIPMGYTIADGEIISKEYGGQGCDILTYAMCVEELAKVCGTTAVIVSAHTSLCCDPILTFGQKIRRRSIYQTLQAARRSVLSV